MDPRAPAAPFKAVVYGPACTKRTHACYDLVRGEPSGGLLQRIAQNTLVNPHLDVKVLRNAHQFGRSNLEIWDLTFGNPRMNGLLDGFVIHASVVVIAVPEQDEDSATQDLLRAYETSVRATGVLQNAPLHKLVIARTDTHLDVAHKLCHALVAV